MRFEYERGYIAGLELAAEIAQGKGYTLNGSGPSHGEIIALEIRKSAEKFKKLLARGEAE